MGGAAHGVLGRAAAAARLPGSRPTERRIMLCPLYSQCMLESQRARLQGFSIRLQIRDVR